MGNYRLSEATDAIALNSKPGEVHTHRKSDNWTTNKKLFYSISYLIYLKINWKFLAVDQICFLFRLRNEETRMN